MKKLSSSILMTIVSLIVIATILMSVTSVYVLHNKVYEDKYEYLQTYAEKTANEINTSYSSYEAIVATMAQYLSSAYDLEMLEDGEYNLALKDSLVPFVISVNEEYSDLLSVFIALNPTYTKGVYVAWSSGGQEMGYASKEDLESTK